MADWYDRYDAPHLSSSRPPHGEGTPLAEASRAGSLATWFDPMSVVRGQRYAEEKRVDDLVVNQDGPGLVDLVGRVRGSGSSYRSSVRVEHDHGDWRVSGHCTCPVGWWCKHMVAVLVVAAEQEAAAPPAAPTWEDELDELLLALEGTSDEEVLPLGLEFELTEPLWRPRHWGRALEPQLLLRPVRRGAKKRWVRGGVGWHELGRHASVPADRLDPRQLGLVQELAAARHTYDPYRYRGEPDLGDFGAAVWPLLRQAREVGVELVAGKGITTLTLADEPATVDLDATTDDDRRLLRARVRAAGRTWSGPEVLVLGERGHGVALVRRQERPRVTEVVLGPVANPVPPAVRRLLTAEEPVALPADAADRLSSDYLPRLRRHLAVGSSDGTVEVAEAPRPTLVLTLTWRGAGHVSLEWWWRYQRGGRTTTHPVDEPVSRRSLRHAEAEVEIVAGLDLGERWESLLLLSDGSLSARQVLRGDRVVRLLGEVVPHLQENPDVEVVDAGVAVAHRPAEGEPQISFESAAAPEDPEDRDGTDWLDLDVVVTVDGERIPLPMIIAALTRGDDYIVLDSGLIVDADHPALVKLAEAVRAARQLHEVDEEGPGLRVGKLDLGVWAELAELGVVTDQAERWVQAARSLADLQDLPDVEPAGIVSELRPYQRDGFRWLALLQRAGLGGILADDMGLGKTLQALAAISHARAEGAGPFLVVAPTSVVGNWQHEAARHAPGLVVRTISASQRRRGTTIDEEAEGVDVLVTSYTLLRLEVDQYAGLAWGGLVLDEAQQVKNRQAKTYKAVRMVDAPFRVALTGTPFENRLMELWSILSIVAPGLYPYPRQFTEQVVVPVERGRDAAALDRFRTRLRPFLLRRTKALVADELPPKQEQVLDVVLEPRHRKVYDAQLQHERQNILGLLPEFDENRVAILQALTRLRQMSLDAALVDPSHAGLGSAKIDLLVDHLREVAAEGHRALVFSQFTRFLRAVRDRLAEAGLDTVYLDGATTDRPKVIEEFRSGDAPAFLISLKAGGVGLTLTEADYVFVLDPWWNPAAENQAVDRAHRIGQTRPVVVYRLVATDTIEEKVMELKARKAALFARVLEGDGALDAAVTADDVRALVDP